MPEQPPDPLHYEMKIPPEPKKQKGPEKPPSDPIQSDKDGSDLGNEPDTSSIRRAGKPHAGREEK